MHGTGNVPIGMKRMICTEYLSVNRNSDAGCVSLLRCKRWSCDICNPYNRSRVIRIAKAGKPNTFITLTCNPARYSTHDEAARDMKRALVLLRRHVDKELGIKRLPFLCVFEKTKKGWPHMHILCRVSWIDQRWLSSQMARLIGAPVVDIRRIKDRGKAAAYVSKYVGKDTHKFEGCQRWWRSRNYNEEPEDVPIRFPFGDRWEIQQGRLDVSLRVHQWMGYEIKNQRKNYYEWQVPENWLERRGCSPPTFAYDEVKLPCGQFEYRRR